MKQWICIEDGNFQATRKVKKGEILWADKMVPQNINIPPLYHIFENFHSDESENRYVLGLPVPFFEKHFMLLTEWREKQLNNVLK